MRSYCHKKDLKHKNEPTSDIIASEMCPPPTYAIDRKDMTRHKDKISQFGIDSPSIDRNKTEHEEKEKMSFVLCLSC